jgi:TPR repeat protein
MTIRKGIGNDWRRFFEIALSPNLSTCDKLWPPGTTIDLSHTPQMTTHWLMVAAFSQLIIGVPGIAQQSATPANSVQRGFGAIPPGEPTRRGHHYVVAVGIDHYQNWPILSTAVNDATGFAKLLTSQLGFEYAAEPLTEKNATRDSINSLIDDELRGKLKPEDDLVIFFAGHGTTRKDKVGDVIESMGFLVPVEARAPGVNEHWSDYLNIEEFLGKVSTLPPQHILVVLDSCHSGMALGSKFTSKRGDTRFEREMARKLSREIITSARGDELAADQGPLPDHSLFTGLILQGLSAGKINDFGQGFVTASELGAYAQRVVATAANSKQIPSFGSFDLDDGGELIIPLGSGIGSTTASATSLDTKEPVLATLNAPLTRAAELYAKSCDNGDPNSCRVLGDIYLTGKGLAPDYTQSAAAYRKACDAGAPKGCTSLASAYSDGKGVARDLVHAAEFFRKGCDGGEAWGCAMLGAYYKDGKGVGRDWSQAAVYYQKGCDDGVPWACNNLGSLYEDGLGVAQNWSQTFELYRKSCDMGWPLGCSNLGTLYGGGRGVAQDHVKEAELYRKACDRGEALGCPT